MRFTDASPPYQTGAVGTVRDALENADRNILTADPSKVATLIYDTTRVPNAPRRLTLGRDSYESVHRALTGRIAALESQRALAEFVNLTD
ncbi:hypothetical protein [Mycobacterium sp. PS03-16]|uniref:hypothetical protein n=1 Tax=Mycobacterium sp. PS03-16 TaxID=2559611 RepID=UPI001ADD9184|nr:hypothetical protein [Mycobacterium sp. PS03-16]